MRLLIEKTQQGTLTPEEQVLVYTLCHKNLKGINKLLQKLTVLVQECTTIRKIKKSLRNVV